MNLLGGVTAYDTLFPGALVRVTFQKAHIWHPADEFMRESQNVYNRLSSVAHVYPAQRFPLLTDANAWSVDVRTQTERSVSELSRALSDACDIPGLVDVVEVGSMEVLTLEKIKGSNTSAGARERANAADQAGANAASNPLDAAKNALNSLGAVGKWVVLGLLALAVVLIVTRKQ